MKEHVAQSESEVFLIISVQERRSEVKRITPHRASANSTDKAEEHRLVVFL